MSTITASQTTSTFELNPIIQCNDLKAFERRLMETILQQKPRERLWRIVLAISLTTTAISSYFWLQDSMNSMKRMSSFKSDDSEMEFLSVVEEQEMTFFQSLQTHYFFTTNCIVLFVLFLFGIHQRVIQTNIIVNRIREVLYDFALSCDDQGKLIVKQNFSRSFTIAPFSPTSTMMNNLNCLSSNNDNGGNSNNNHHHTPIILGSQNQIQRRP